MVDFIAESPPLNVDPELGEYIARLERRLLEMSQQIHDFQTLHVEPKKRSDGMVRHADGTDWNPGYGKGLYYYDAPTDTWQPAFFVTDQETDPIFKASPSYEIASTDIDNWDVAYSWGDHSLAGYLLTEASLVDAGAGDESLISDGIGPAMSLKTISAGANITLLEAADDIVISSPSGDFELVGGEGGESIVHGDTVWPTLIVKSLNDSASIDISSTANALTFAVLPAGVDHDALNNYDADEHIDWTVTGAEDVHDDRIPSSAVTQHVGSLVHNSLSGLTSGDPHTQYFLIDGSRATAPFAIEQNTTPNDDGAQIIFYDADTVRTVYTENFIRRKGNEFELGIRDPTGTNPDVIILEVRTNDTTGSSNTVIRSGSGSAILFQDYDGTVTRGQFDDNKFETQVPIVINQITAEPSAKEAGMLVHADGTSWDPGSGQGLYYYTGSSWVFLA